MSIFTGVQKFLGRKRLQEDEERIKADLLHKNEDKILDISQRTGILLNSGLTEAEKQYILSDSIVSSAIQLYLADVVNLCDKSKCTISCTRTITDEEGDLSRKLERVKFVFNQICKTELIEQIILALLNNGEIFLSTKFNKGLNQCFINETSYVRCVELCFENGETACFVASNEPTTESSQNAYSYDISGGDKRSEIVEADKMVRIFNPTLSNSKVCVELDDGEDSEDKNQFKNSVLNDSQDEELSLSAIARGNYLYCVNSMSLLKQIYPDWLNSKLLELAVYRDRIARSRFIQLIALELGRTSKQTSDQIYDNIKDYFDRRAVIDLEQQTFKSVVGNEPFIDYKVYITRNGNGQLTFDNSLNGQSTDVNALADLDYNQKKLFAGLGIPKQYLGGDDDGSALSNGSSLFFLDEKYQKRVLAYIKRIEAGLKQAVKNIIKQSEEREDGEGPQSDFFYDFDFDIHFAIPENNQDVMAVKTAKLEYLKNLLELVQQIESAPNHYIIDTLSNILGDDLRKISALLEAAPQTGGEDGASGEI